MNNDEANKILERMAPLFGLEKKKVGKNSFRWAEKPRIPKSRPTLNAVDVAYCSCPEFIEDVSDGMCKQCSLPPAPRH